MQKTTKFVISLACFFNLSLPAQSQDLETAHQYAKGLSVAFEEAAKNITPSVVNVTATIKAPKNNRNIRPGLPEELEPFRDFFDQFAPKQPNSPEPQQGFGTGVIVDQSGHILTNNHVVGEATDITVRTQDGKTFKAQVVGKDPRTDVAVIKIKASNLVPAKFADSDDLKIGEWVVAAGNPFGLDNTITAGIVSAKGRSIMGGNQYEDFIQTDAAINPGNSGGPLINLNGEVVGINTAIFSQTGGYMGIGFAIPINMAKTVMESLISNGKVVRGWLGVGIQNLSEDLAKSFNFPNTEGALVGQVQEDSPAQKAGFKQGDIVIEAEGQKIKSSNQLRNLVAGFVPGKKVDLVVVRDGEHKTLTVKVGELPTQLAEQMPENGPGTESQSGPAESIGVRLKALTPEIAKRLKTKQTKGVIVEAVKPDGLAAASGIQPADIIISVNGKRVNSIGDLDNLLTEADLSRGVRMIVETQGMERFIFLKSEG